ncbi:putative TPR repeat protein [Alcanivorax xiamenensis]|uniref:TPR repeat protein n=1 Tax=Alcanivorax xiamenensis TaxID=1177156 RepID=A0ABQ6Y3E7_9GAMM|nr:SH3 domain-containing protein [Alcanivorax xiamenensis]KAF0803270.1 putative TPR repeat protein [Alcanivorax xiamenensis]
MKLCSPLAALLLLGGSADALSDYQTGQALYQQGRFASAVHEWYADAERGEPKAQFALGMMFERGRGVRKDMEEAHKWYRLAAENNFPDAQIRLAQLYMVGALDGGAQEGKKWYARAAAGGSALAQFMLGLLYLEGRGVESDEKQAAHWFELAANQGYAPAQNNLGSFYQAGQGVEQNFTRAFELFQDAARQGDARAQNNLGSLYAKGHGVDKNQAWAVFWFTLSAQQGNEVARKNIAASLPRLQRNLIAGSRVNIRSGAGTGYKRITRMEKGDTVYVLGKGGGWTQIYFEQGNNFGLGWVASRLLQGGAG